MRLLVLAALAGALASGQSNPEQPPSILFLPLEKRDAAFRAMEKLYPVRKIPAGGKVRKLPAGKPLRLALDLETYLRDQRVAGMIILVDGKIRLERYGLGFGPEGRWTSFSMAKSVTSTLAGMALKDGRIKSLADPVTNYLPGLKGSAYEGVTVRQLLTMTSGVKWNEDYTDPNSDVARFSYHQPEPGEDVTVSFMRKLPREAEPGTKWLYKTGETNLIGVLVSRAAGKNLSEYLSEKIWKPYGMEAEANWQLGSTGHEVSGCCISARLRDYARIGQFILEGGRIKGRPQLPDSWLAEATTKQASTGAPGGGYGYQWWTRDDGSFNAFGIFGQSMLIDPQRKLVAVTLSSWPQATDRRVLAPARNQFFAAVQAAVDAERPK
jgi:CubicO group peptidase (beta-lactamase class C family)